MSVRRRLQMVVLGLAVAMSPLVVPLTPATAAVTCNMTAYTPYRWVSRTNHVWVGSGGEVRCSGGVTTITITATIFRDNTWVGSDRATSRGPLPSGDPLISMVMFSDVPCVPGEYHAEVTASVSTGFRDAKVTPPTTVTVC